MNLYISDLHFGHKAVINFDNRPFADVEEMDRALNAAACINHYMPVSFQELMANNIAFQVQQEGCAKLHSTVWYNKDNIETDNIETENM